MCGMILWAAPVKVRMKFHELRHSTNTLLAALGVPENVRADILGHRTRAMTRRYTHLTVQQMRDGFRKLDAASPIHVAPGAPVATAAYARRQPSRGARGSHRPCAAGTAPSGRAHAGRCRPMLG